MSVGNGPRNAPQLRHEHACSSLVHTPSPHPLQHTSQFLFFFSSIPSDIESKRPGTFLAIEAPPLFPLFAFQFHGVPFIILCPKLYLILICRSITLLLSVYALFSIIRVKTIPFYLRLSPHSSQNSRGPFVQLKGYVFFLRFLPHSLLLCLIGSIIGSPYADLIEFYE